MIIYYYYYYDYYDYYYYYYIRLTVFFQDNLGKPAPERQTILHFTAARDDGVAVASVGVLDHMQIIYISLQTDNHASTSPVFAGRMPFLPPNQQRQSTEGNL